MFINKVRSTIENFGAGISAVLRTKINMKLRLKSGLFC
jgi:hypothetical protein